MKKKEKEYGLLTRQRISNPSYGIPHGELLKKAGVINLENNYTIEVLKNGRWAIHPIDENKKF